MWWTKKRPNVQKDTELVFKKGFSISLSIYLHDGSVVTHISDSSGDEGVNRLEEKMEQIYNALNSEDLEGFLMVKEPFLIVRKRDVKKVVSIVTCH